MWLSYDMTLDHIPSHHSINSCTVIPDRCYRESILNFLNIQQLLAGVKFLPRSLATAFKWFSMLPGFAPAGEPLLFRQKWPKPLTPSLATLDGSDAGLKSGPTRCPQTRPAEYKERPTLGPDSRGRIVRKGREEYETFK